MNRYARGKRFTKVLLAGVLTAGLFPAVAWGNPSAPEISVVDQLVEKSVESVARFSQTGKVDDLVKTDAYEGATQLFASNGPGLPEKFDLRDKEVVTPVKLQNPWSTCWSFGANAAAEISIMTDLGLSVADGEAIDLSERHTAWFSYLPLPEGYGAQTGEGMYAVDDQGNPSSASKDVLSIGGFPFTATSVFSSGIGVVGEQNAPYKNNEGIRVEEKDRWYYSDKGDWSVDERLRFTQAFELEESSVLPTPAGRSKGDEYVYNPAGTDAIKQEVSEGRAVTMGFSADTSRPGQESAAKYINPDTWAHYTYEKDAGANHAVTIVGWDDAYSKDNFLPDHQPDEDGAWIVKNSWGSIKEASPNHSAWGLDGYFYLSYYDMSIQLPESFEFDKEHKNDYFIDQYDYMPSVGVTSVKKTTPVSMANVFPADGDMMVRSLSCETASPQTTVTYQLYLLNSTFASPIDGTLLDTKVETYAYGGYHRVSLGEGHLVKAGQSYAVVATEKTATSFDLLVEKGTNRDGMLKAAAGKDFSSYVKGVVNKGESYFTEDGGTTWSDWSDAVAKLKAKEAVRGVAYYDYDNFALKAYSDPAPSSTAIVPDLGGMTEADAVAALEKAGFAGKAGEPAYSDTVATGCVMGQDVAAGTEQEKGSTITYMLSLGKKPVQPVVPDETPTGGQSGLKTPLASTGDSARDLAGVVSLGALLACATLVATRKRLHTSKPTE